MGALAIASSVVPLCPDLLRVCARGRGALWRAAWRGEGGVEGFALPSSSAGRIRPGGGYDPLEDAGKTLGVTR